MEIFSMDAKNVRALVSRMYALVRVLKFETS